MFQFKRHRRAHACGARRVGAGGVRRDGVVGLLDQITIDGLAGAHFASVPHHGRQEYQIARRQHAPIHRHRAGGRAAVGIAGRGDRKIRRRWHRHGDADKPLAQQQTGCRLSLCHGSRRQGRAIRAVEAQKHRIGAGGRRESLLQTARRHCPGVLRVMAGGTRARVAAEGLEERVAPVRRIGREIRPGTGLVGKARRDRRRRGRRCLGGARSGRSLGAARRGGRAGAAGLHQARRWRRCRRSTGNDGDADERRGRQRTRQRTRCFMHFNGHWAGPFTDVSRLSDEVSTSLRCTPRIRFNASARSSRDGRQFWDAPFNGLATRAT